MKLIRALLLLAGLFVFTNAHALKTKADQQAAMSAFIIEMKTHYGMAKFKKKHFGIDLDQLQAKYSRLIDEAKTIEEDLGWDPEVKRDILPPEEFRQLMIGMVAELKDGHTNASRQGSEAATLGIATAPVGEKLIVTAVRKDFLLPNSSTMEIQPGDEILELDGMSVAEHAKRNLIYMQGGTFQNRYNTAMVTVTLNYHPLLRAKKEGEPAVLKLRRNGKVFVAHLRWVYRNDFNLLAQMFPKELSDPLKKIMVEDVPVPYGVSGTVRSYFRTGLLKSSAAGGMIDIGAGINRAIIETKEHSARPQTEANPELIRADLKDLTPISRLQLYMVRHKGKNIAVLRIPSYSPGSVEAVKAEYKWLAQGLKQVQQLADVLVIDQLSNAGGYVFYGARMLSLFANGDTPMQTVLADYKLNVTMLENIKPDASKDPIDGTSQIHAQHKLYRKYFEELKMRFESGEGWTGLGPAFDLGVPDFKERAGEIFPAREGVYTGPILLLNDRFSASGGDFFPAQMQSNKRALIKGDTSCGLGGPVYRNTPSMPGSELSFRCTFGYAELPNGWPIENIGTVADLHREIGESDLADGFKSYATEVLDDAVALANKEEFTKRTAPQGIEMIEIPAALKEDIILRTLYNRLEVVARLKEMRNLERWNKDKASLALIEELIAKGEAAKPGTRFADPCEIRLAMTPLKP